MMKILGKSVQHGWLLLLVLLFTACREQPEPVTTPALEANVAAAPSTGMPLIPRADLFGNPEKAAADISPDGNWLSWLAPHQGALNIWVAPIADLSLAEPVTDAGAHGVDSYEWAGNSSHIVYYQDRNGVEDFHLYSVNVVTKKVIDLTPHANISAFIQHNSPQFPDHLVIAINDRGDRSLHDLYLVSVHDGSRQLLYQNDRFAQLYLDDNYQLHFASENEADGGFRLYQLNTDKQWQPFSHIPMEDALTTWILRIEDGGKGLLWVDSRNRDKAAVYRQDAKSGEMKLIFESGRADVEYIDLHPITHEVRAVSVNYLRRQWHLLDDSFRADFDYLSRLHEGELQLLNTSRDDKRWLVAYQDDNHPSRTFLYDRISKLATRLFITRPVLDGLPLASMQALEMGARDGMTLISYLSLPFDADPDNDGKPTTPLPMVLIVHGGPWDRDYWGFNQEHQWLANRGYAVLSVNFRGSTGFGKQFVNAGNQEWGGKMQTDLLDAVQWAIKNGVADENKIAIYGGSYGGYATLVGLTQTPNTFACGVDIVGPSDLQTMIQYFPAYWKSFQEQWLHRVGDPSSEAGRALLKSRSPLHFVDQIKKPLLIAQGQNDPRVSHRESEQIVNAMLNRNMPVTYLVFPDEGHGFLRPENDRAFYAITEEFLARCLGGRVQMPGDDLLGSSVQIRVGEQWVPASAEAMRAPSGVLSETPSEQAAAH